MFEGIVIGIALTLFMEWVVLPAIWRIGHRHEFW